MEISVPVNSTVSLVGAGSEILCALDGGESMVGRSGYSDFPPQIEDVTLVGKSPHSPDLEKILELKPDLVIADGMLSDDRRERIEDAGVPVIVESSSDPTTVTTGVSHLGVVLDEEDRAEEVNGFIEHYQEIIEERTADLEEGDKPKVFLEWSTPYFSVSSETPFHNHITSAGGINIAGEESAKYPTVSPEWIVEKDPDVIIRCVYATENLTEEMLGDARDEIFSRPGFDSIAAVKDDRVHILGGPLISGVRSIVGELYLAKWFHPDLFGDIDPETVHEELVQEFFGLELGGCTSTPEQRAFDDVLAYSRQARSVRGALE